ncbi:hypothetical protein BDB00DRAFT_423882 [Zychaea mexicana]|uniref:uncharacterized protein n=1 Tax=Zychaea mexicana TaxID=64656 RepID=UPI0022FE6CF8|nr:uncharacterized protein BDB00DRAFT_423882 [Zychaea mexicana]KAI9492589.1 hypothetical protein BDB00DRAFT_423882 [Zychaea mexicana]
MDVAGFFVWLWIIVMWIIIAVVWYYLFVPCICGLLVELWYAIGCAELFYRLTPDEFRVYPRDEYVPEYHEPLYMCYCNPSVCLYMGWHFWARTSRKLRNYYQKRFDGSNSSTTSTQWRRFNVFRSSTLYESLLPMTRTTTTAIIPKLSSITTKIKKFITASSSSSSTATTTTNEAQNHVLVEMNEFGDDGNGEDKHSYHSFATTSNASNDELLENNDYAQRDEATVPLLQQQ